MKTPPCPPATANGKKKLKTIQSAAVTQHTVHQLQTLPDSLLVLHTLNAVTLPGGRQGRPAGREETPCDATLLTSAPWHTLRLLRAGEGSADRRGVTPPFFSSSPEGDFGTVHTGTPSAEWHGSVRGNDNLIFNFSWDEREASKRKHILFLNRWPPIYYKTCWTGGKRGRQGLDRKLHLI